MQTSDGLGCRVAVAVSAAVGLPDFAIGLKPSRRRWGRDGFHEDVEWRSDSQHRPFLIPIVEPEFGRRRRVICRDHGWIVDARQATVRPPQSSEVRPSRQFICSVSQRASAVKSRVCRRSASGGRVLPGTVRPRKPRTLRLRQRRAAAPNRSAGCCRSPGSQWSMVTDSGPRRGLFGEGARGNGPLALHVVESYVGSLPLFGGSVGRIAWWSLGSHAALTMPSRRGKSRVGWRREQDVHLPGASRRWEAVIRASMAVICIS